MVKYQNSVFPLWYSIPNLENDKGQYPDHRKKYPTSAQQLNDWVFAQVHKAF